MKKKKKYKREGMKPLRNGNKIIERKIAAERMSLNPRPKQ